MAALRRNPTGLLALIIITLTAFLASAAIPSAAAPLGRAAGSQAQSTRQVSYNGIRFTYGSSLASQVVAGVVTEQKGDSNSAFWETHPDETVFAFRDFTYSTSTMMPATIYVFPAKSDYAYL